MNKSALSNAGINSFIKEKNNDDTSVLTVSSTRRTVFLYPSLVIFLSALFLFYKYLLQFSPSVMTDDLMHAFHVKGAGLGNLAAMYFYSYLIAQLFVGVLLDKYSPRILTSLAIVSCAIATMIFACAESLWLAELSRLLLGAWAAFATISYMKMTSIWFRPNQFAFINGLLATAAMIGALCGEAPLAILVQSVGWRHSLLLCGVIGIAIGCLFFILVRDKKQATVSKNYTRSYYTIAWKDILLVLRNRQNWLLALYSGLCFSPVAVFGSLWGNPFLQESYHFTSPQAANLISFLFIGVAIGGPIWGYTADHLGKQLWIMAGGALLGLFALLAVIYYPFQSTYLLGISLFLSGFGIGSFMLGFSVGKEINNAALAATVVAFINMGDAVFGAVSEPVVGKILDIFWTGKIVNGIPHFSISDYHITLALLPLDLVAALFFILLIHLRRSPA